MKLSRRMSLVEASGIRKVFDRAAALDEPVNLSIGQPSFDVPEEVREEAKRAIEQGENKYTGTRGLKKLRHRISESVRKRTGIYPDATMVTAGVSGGLLLSLLSLVDRGDEVLFPDPYFVSYEQLSHVVEARPVPVDTYPDFKLTPEAVQRRITDDTTSLIFNNPVNPTGVAYSKNEVQEIAEVCRGHDIMIISDEIYTRFRYGVEQYSMISAAPERTVLLEGGSKTWGMPGWRVGWACGPEDVIDAMVTLQQFSFVCANTPAQHATITAFEHDMSEEIAAYCSRRDFLCEQLHPAYDFVRPEGAFYLFPEVPGSMSGEEFVEAALDRELLIVPGSVFSSKDSHFRISFAVDEVELKEGVQRLNQLAEEL